MEWSWDWFWAADYSVARFLLERGIALIYLLAFVSALHQFPALLGERGLLPVPAYLAYLPWRRAPSLFHFGYTDGRLRLLAGAGAALSALLLIGLPQAAPLPVTMAAWLALWVLYLSIVTVGQTFYAFGWESLLLDAGFLAIFLGNAETAPPLLVILLFRWLVFRVEFGAGLIKMRGDDCWRDLTCMQYHHETQPMPNPLSWWFHHLPRPLHRLEVLGNHAAQLVMPFGLFLPQPIAAIAAGLMILTQGYLVVSGNYAWLNAITIVIAASALPDALFGPLAGLVATGAPGPPWFIGLVLAVTAMTVILSWWPVRNMLGRRQLMNYSFNPFHLVNTYGAFGSVTRERYEVVIEGTRDAVPDESAEWREYAFIGKPGDPRRRPRQVAPYHLRLDWLMWFVPLSPAYAADWLPRLVEKLLDNDAATLRLMGHNPFPDAPPRWIRARFFRYRFTSWRERRETGAWWAREPAGTLLPPVRGAAS
ncbi:MAG TPA: lipase maturation factor family protein [Candidatus Limnocylindria bacterium]|nr:lipase maturation factor family protein [Candidatus Limnocylindria bacterium]